MILIYLSCKDIEEAKKIGKTLLEKHLAACINFFPIQSMFWWEEKIEEADEAALLIKTLKQNYKAIKVEVEKIHSYKVPFIGAFKVNQINEPYYHYLKKNVKKYYGKKSSLAKPNLKVKPYVR
ncbi:divalent-cation tolerance protein CutA [candidate division WWE3 bacterium CG06_land_8_20_14_3_00_42_16]|uniref:Divalent-cation tolerance protein CutA n=3 Tax=Katanobacteria TaxID=422282 RepID=A0A2M7APP5_UNCKA|nr:MAG: hypothetical protein AUJ38_00605 [bacterium CG1_02_42_9]PIU69368.1 MAG: divalent-cation tolerance protein CutA [candidate division WWE3 bacterium CG06_land_8_20_14_3_00_42_16]PIZ43469.1 MAG: divalent-cation tolerance protein CutA [candidate division WWE3 bacterium CG_4_10_14_0_2_um_filter_42_8]PJC69221.1 MAG: divalent-cation tolerance protein CutA [candidate division WWE3 bacterium CG_4_8_14_3_um_filter_42_11]